MPAKILKTPAYRHYKPKDLAVVRINGKDIYLGKYDSPQSWQKYRQVIAASLAGTVLPALPSSTRAEAIGINSLVEKYLNYCRSYYSRDGKPGTEYRDMISALSPLCELYGLTLVSEFGPLSLKQVREHMIHLGWSRTQVNKQINRTKRCFKWGVAEELVPAEILLGLQSVPGLRYGRTTAPECEPIHPVADEAIDATLPYMSPVVADMVRIQRITGMRPCELVLMRPSDIDRSALVWVYEPSDHKNRWRGHRRLISLGPKAQAILQRYLERGSNGFLFSPQETKALQGIARREQRRSPMTPSQAQRKPKKKPIRSARERYDTNSYRRAISYAIKKANKKRQEEAPKPPLIPNWFPLQIRHTRATEVRRHYGLDGAQSAMGHKNADVTQVYAEKNLELASRIAQEMG